MSSQLKVQVTFNKVVPGIRKYMESLHYQLISPCVFRSEGDLRDSYYAIAALDNIRSSLSTQNLFEGIDYSIIFDNFSLEG